MTRWVSRLSNGPLEVKVFVNHVKPPVQETFNVAITLRMHLQQFLDALLEFTLLGLEHLDDYSERFVTMRYG